MALNQLSKWFSFLSVLCILEVNLAQGNENPAQRDENMALIGEQVLAVVPFDYIQDANQQTVEDITAGLFTAEFSVQSFIEEISYGKASIAVIDQHQLVNPIPAVFLPSFEYVTLGLHWIKLIRHKYLSL